MVIKSLIELWKFKKPENNSETNVEEILRERFIPPEPRHKIINDLRLKEGSYWLFKINIII